MEKKKILEFQNISKSFVGVKALSDVSFSVREGEVHGSFRGKRSWQIHTDEDLVRRYMRDQEGVSGWTGNSGKKHEESERLGISIIYQELNLIPELSVAENIFWIASQRETVY